MWAAGREPRELPEEGEEGRWPGILKAAEERAHRLAKKVIRTLVTLAPDIPECKTSAGPPPPQWSCKEVVV